MPTSERLKEYRKLWRYLKRQDPDFLKRDRELRKIVNRRWLKNNPGKAKAYRIIWRENNKDKVHAINKRWRDKNKPKLAELQRNWQHKKRKAEGLARGARVNALLRKRKANV